MLGSLFIYLQYSISGSRPYHKLCYMELHHPRCDVCKDFVSTVYWVLILQEIVDQLHILFKIALRSMIVLITKHV